MSRLKVSIAMTCLMALAAAGGIAARPTSTVSASGPKFLLEDVIPKRFGAWQELPDLGAQVVNPQTKQILDKIYSQTLTRTYVNGEGYRVMLSLAYGDDQRGALAAHKPETCYPAQGFELRSNIGGQLATPYGSIPVRRLDTALGARQEPVTYWFTVGESAITNRLQQRLVEVKMGLTGQIPDGLLFRVSSIDGQPPRAFAVQDVFVKDLLTAVNEKDRMRLSGLSVPAN